MVCIYQKIKGLEGRFLENAKGERHSVHDRRKHSSSRINKNPFSDLVKRGKIIVHF
jgi:hypothetical protein